MELSEIVAPRLQVGLEWKHNINAGKDCVLSRSSRDNRPKGCLLALMGHAAQAAPVAIPVADARKRIENHILFSGQLRGVCCAVRW